MSTDILVRDIDLDWVKIAKLILSMLFAAVVIFLQMPQMITGVIINMILILAADRLGTNKAMLLGMITPIIAAFSGVLPITLMAMIPFIAVANAVFVSSYNILAGKNRMLAVAAAAVLKFCFLYAAVNLLLLRPLTVFDGKIYSVGVSQAVAFMMGWPQLVTALIGGTLAVGILTSMNKFSKK
jgi:riboflavin transporter